MTGAALLEAGPFSATDAAGRVLLDGVTIRLPEARLVTLSGPSGTGKSTLLRAICGLAPAGDVRRRVGGDGFDDGRLAEWRARVTLLAQDAPSLPGTVGHNLSFPFRTRVAASRPFRHDAAERALAAVGLGALPFERDVRTLSGGERHRLALARGLLWDPPVLVADEPLSGLDGDTAVRCFERLAAFARRAGHAVLCVLHDEALGASSDERWRLDAGTLGRLP